MARIQRYGVPCLSVAQAVLVLKEWWSNVCAIPAPSVNRTAELELLGQLDEDFLEAAICQVIARHDLLRTAILGVKSAFPLASPSTVERLRCAANAENKAFDDLRRLGLLDPRSGLLGPAIFRQSVEPLEYVKIDHIDLSNLSGVGQFAEAKRIANALVRVPRDLATPPFVRATLLRLNANHHQLLVSGSPVAFDAESFDVLLAELQTFYRSFSAGVPCPSLELPIQFSDFARWEWGHLSGSRLDDLLAFWQAQWSRVALEPLPLANKGESLRTASLSAVIDRTFLFELRRAAQRQRITEFMLFSLALILVLYAHFRQEDVTMLTVFTNRTRPETFGLIGRFGNTNLLNVRVSPKSNIANVARDLRDAVSAAVEHQELPVPELWLGTETPNVPVTFRMVRYKVSHWVPGLLARRIILHDGHPLNTVDVLVEQSGDSANVTIRGYPDRLSQTFFNSLSTDYNNVLRALAAEPNWPRVTVGQLIGTVIGQTR